MIRHLIFVVLVLALTVLQTTLVPIALPEWMQPDILLAVVVLMGLLQPRGIGSIYAFGIGYLMDLMIGVVLTGTFTLERLLLFLAAYWLNGQFYAKSPFIQFMVVTIMAILDYILLWILIAVFSGKGSDYIELWQMVPRALSSGLMGLALYYPLIILWEGGQREF